MRWRGVALAAALVALGACAGSRRPPPPMVGDPPPLDSGDDGAGALVRELELDVLASYDRLALDAASAGAIIDPDVGLTAIGVAPLELGAAGVPSRWPVIEAEGEPVEVVSRALELHLSGDRTVAWTHDQLSLHLRVCGRTAAIPLRIMQVYARDAERWTLVAEHLGYAQSVERWLADEAPLGTPMPAALEEHDGARAAAARLRAALAVDADRAALWNASAEAFAVWPDARPTLRGPEVRTGPTLAASVGATALAVDSVRLTLGPGRSTAIGAASVLATVDRGGEPAKVRLRASAVLELDEQAGWQVRAMMVSTPIRVPSLVARTLGVVASVAANRVSTRCTPGAAPATAALGAAVRPAEPAPSR